MTEPAIDEIRRVREIISAEIGADLKGLVDRYTEMEALFTKPPITKGAGCSRHVVVVTDHPPSYVSTTSKTQ